MVLHQESIQVVQPTYQASQDFISNSLVFSSVLQAN
jgi:hypothetical protein